MVSKGLILLMAIGVFAALLALIWGLQHPPTQYTIVEVSFMEEEAAAAEASSPPQQDAARP